MSNVDISIVITTVGRDSILRALSSIFQQRFIGNIQVIIALDMDLYGKYIIYKKVINDTCPSNINLTWIELGYSTSIKHGGIHSCKFGGSLRTIMSFMARSKYVMYLDDDDWLAVDHIKDILNSIENRYWSYAYCYYADGNNDLPLCIDKIESVGVNKGIYKEKFGGFVRPSGMLVNKLLVSEYLYLWADSPYESGDGEDRLIFDKLRYLEHACTGNPTVYYSLDPKDANHNLRLNYMKSQGVNFNTDYKQQSVRD